MGRPPSLPTPTGETEVERRLVEELRRVCGPLLSAFLLAGYGRDESVKCRSFGVTARDDLGPSGVRIVEARSGAEFDLPSGREPLVFAAVLRRLFEGSGDTEVVTYHREVLESLGWKDTADERQFVQRALAKYADMAILEVRTPQHGTTRSTDPVTITRLHPVVEFRAAVTMAGAGVGDDPAFRLEFSESFAAGLPSGCLFGAVWEELLGAAAAQLTITRRVHLRVARDDRISCPGCGRRVVPRLWHYGRGTFLYMRTQHLCPFCGVVMYETGGGIRWGCLAPVLLLLFLLAALGFLFNYARFG